MVSQSASWLIANAATRQMPAGQLDALRREAWLTKRR